MKINCSCGWKVASGVIIACQMLFIVGCASMLSAMISGGEVAGPNYVPDKILVTYKPVVLDGEEMIFHLIETSTGLAIYETIQGKPADSIICTMHWDDAENDYFGCYFGRRDAWRYVVPKDRTKDAKRYRYGIRPGMLKPKYINGGFEIKYIDGVTKQIVEKDPAASVPTILSPM